jgi:hypothetical protein
VERFGRSYFSNFRSPSYIPTNLPFRVEMWDRDDQHVPVSNRSAIADAIAWSRTRNEMATSKISSFIECNNP